MFEELIGGALWGLGTGLVLTAVKEGEAGLRPILRTAMRAYVQAADKFQEMAAETRENFGDVYAEAQAERRAEAREDGR